MNIKKFYIKGPINEDVRPFYQLAGCLTKHGKKDRSINVVNEMIRKVKQKRRIKLKDYSVKNQEDKYRYIYRNIREKMEYLYTLYRQRQIMKNTIKRSIFLTSSALHSIRTAIQAISPFWNIIKRSSKRGKSFHLIPTSITPNRKIFLAIKWLREAVDAHKFNHKDNRAEKWCVELYKVMMGDKRCGPIKARKNYYYLARRNYYKINWINKQTAEHRQAVLDMEEAYYAELNDPLLVMLEARRKKIEPYEPSLLPGYEFMGFKKFYYNFFYNKYQPVPKQKKIKEKDKILKNNEDI